MDSSWDESLETGNKEIDRQHHEVVSLLDDLRTAASESEVLRVLDEVVSFTILHFHSEEELMKHVYYPPAETHEMVRQHVEFKHYARIRVLEFRTGVQLSVMPLHDFMQEFLKSHEFGLDRVLADWIRAQNGSATDG